MRINPLLLLNKTNLIKRRFEKMGISNPIEEFNKLMMHPKYGICSNFSFGTMFGLLMLIFSGISSIVIIAFQMEFSVKVLPFIVLGIAALTINHFLLFRQDKYLKYFKKFQQFSKKERCHWKWITIIVVLAIVVFSVGSLVLMLKVIQQQK